MNEFPLVMECPGLGSIQTHCAWLQEHRENILGHVARQGVVLFRGFPMVRAEDFDAFVEAFELVNFPYARSLSNAVRVNKTERVFTANEAPPEVDILLHHEMAQTPLYPAKIFFCCLDAADTGGETPICRSDVLFDVLKLRCPAFIDACSTKGLKYTNVMPSHNDAQSGMGRSWQSTLGVGSKDRAEARLRELGYSWEWREDGCLQATTPTLPAIRELENGRTVFFNQLIAAFKGWKDNRNDPSRAIRHGDDTPLDRESAEQAVSHAYALSVDLKWQDGDVALIDNLMVMHGRRTYSGSRVVLASLADAREQRWSMHE